MEHVDAMNASLFAQTGAQIMVQTVDSTNGTDIVEYATELGGRYGVGSAERNNGLVIVLALKDVTQSGLVGNYGIAGGDGLYQYGSELTSMLYAYMEDDFAAGDYDAAVKKAVDAYMDWFADLYGVTIRENYIPAVRETYSAGDGYYTETSGYLAPTMGSLLGSLAALVLALLVLWVVLDALRWSRYRRRYLMPGMGIPTVRYYPVFWGRPRRRRPPPPPGGRARPEAADPARQPARPAAAADADRPPAAAVEALEGAAASAAAGAASAEAVPSAAASAAAGAVAAAAAASADAGNKTRVSRSQGEGAGIFFAQGLDGVKKNRYAPIS